MLFRLIRWVTMTMLLCLFFGCAKYSEWHKLPTNAKYITDIPTTYSLTLEDPAGPSTVTHTLGFDDLPFYALYNTSEIRETDLSIERDKISVEDQKSRILPSLSATGGINYRFYNPPDDFRDWIFTSLNLNWNIFDFLTLYHFRVLAEKRLSSSEMRKELRQKQLCAQATALYLDFWAGYYRLELTRKMLEREEKELADTLYESERGLIPRADLEEAEASVEEARASLRARKLALDSARIGLLRFLSLPHDIRILRPPESFAFEPLPGMDVLLDRHLRTSENIEIANMNVQASRLSWIASKYDRWDNLSTSLNLNASAHDWDWDRDKRSASASVSWTIPIFDRGIYGRRIKSQKIEYTRSLLQRDAAYTQEEENLRSKYIQLEEARANLGKAKREMTTTRRELDNIRWESERGLLAESMRDNAEFTYEKSRLQYRLRYYEWLALRIAFDYIYDNRLQSYIVEKNL
ncbi:MAG: TolC family protein [Candidatus Sumerlaeia bacterium]